MRPEDRDAARVWDMAEACRSILSSVRRVTFDDWMANLDQRQLLIHRVTILGEAANHVSQGLSARHPEIPWRQLVNQRNVLIHAYDDIDYRRLWDTVQTKLPQLLVDLDRLLEDEFPLA